MAQQVKIKAVLRDAQAIRTVWQANPDFVMGDIGLNAFLAALADAERLAEQYSRKRVELSGLRDRRDDRTKELNALVTRFRDGMRAHFGPQSVERKQSGSVGRRVRAAKPEK